MFGTKRSFKTPPPISLMIWYRSKRARSFEQHTAYTEVNPLLAHLSWRWHKMNADLNNANLGRVEQQRVEGRLEELAELIQMLSMRDISDVKTQLVCRQVITSAYVDENFAYSSPPKSEEGEDPYFN